MNVEYQIFGPMSFRQWDNILTCLTDTSDHCEWAQGESKSNAACELTAQLLTNEEGRYTPKGSQELIKFVDVVPYNCDEVAADPTTFYFAALLIDEIDGPADVSCETGDFEI